MTVYEALNKIRSDTFVFFGISIFNVNILNIDNEIDRKIYSLIKNICSLRVKISDQNVEFQSSTILMDGQFFDVTDITEDDYNLLESLVFAKLPVNIRARIADLLWHEKKNYEAALTAIDAYMEMFTLLFSDDDWIESIDMIHRALCISSQIKHTEKHDNACKMVYDHILRIDASDTSFLSLRLIEIVVREKYGSANVLISILNKIIQNSDSNVNKVETAYELMIECFKWKKDNAGIHDTNMALAQYYERKANELGNDDSRSIHIAVYYLKKAVLIYRNSKNKDQAERLQRTIIQLQSKLPQMMRTVTDIYDVSNLHEYMVKCFSDLSFQEAVLRLTQFTTFRKKEDVKKDVIDKLQNFPLSNMFSKSFTNDSGQTVFNLPPLSLHDPEGDQELLTKHIHHQFHSYETTEGDLILKQGIYYTRKI